MIEVTVITPIAPHHQELFVRCADSVRKQTVSCRHLHMVDTECKGPGYIRNKLLEQVKTEYVVFLDADDHLCPEFIEKCLEKAHLEHYVYTDWHEGDKVKATPHGAFWDTAWHLVTCLLHTDMVRIVGGFNENLPAMEDTELFLKFDEYNYCGYQIQIPLVHYTGDGKRSKEAREAGLITNIKLDFSRRFRVGCCGKNDSQQPRPPQGVKQPGDVLVVALWKGNMVTGGGHTGRRYTRVSRPQKLWVSPLDAALRPDLYRVVDNGKPKQKKVKRLQVRKAKELNSFADMLHAAGMLDLPKDVVVSVATLSKIKPNYEKLNTIAQRIYDNGKAQSKQGNISASVGTHSKAIVV